MAPWRVPMPGTSENSKISLLTPLQLGPFKLRHRVVMAPFTRARFSDTLPGPHVALYYAQRATPGGLLITEGTSVSEDSIGFPNTPGIWTRKQVEAWKPIVKAVHDKGGIFFCQIAHVGRYSHTSYQNGRAPISSTNQPIKTGQVAVANGDAFADFSTPRALTTAEVAQYVDFYRSAVRNAMDAGFDGVEIHGAHGMLIDQFFKSFVNDRTNRYGGSLENRARFLEEIVAAVAIEVGANRVGVQVSPFVDDLADAAEVDSGALAVHIATVVFKYHPLYLHVVEPRFHFSGEEQRKTEDNLWPVRRAFRSALMAVGAFDRELGNDAVREGQADLVVYGRWFIANPDLVVRFGAGVAQNQYDRSTFYTSDPVVGYTDYPFLGARTKARA